MDKFTPFAGLAGGLLIGAAATLFILVYGRVLGISGILGVCSAENGMRFISAWR